MKKKVIIGVIILVVISGFVALNVIKANSKGFSRGKAIEVKTVNTKIADIDAYVSVNGIVEEIDKEEVYFDTSVKVNEVYVEKDQKVTKGQELFNLDLDNLYSQLNQAKIQLNIQKIQLEKIKDALNLQNLSQAQATLQNAKTVHEQAKRNYDRYKKLLDEGMASFIEFENAKAQYSSAISQLEIAQNNLDDLTDTNSDLTTNNERDVQNQNEQIKLTQLTINDLQTKIDKLEKQRYSTIDGVITELNVQRGSVTSPAIKAIKLIDPSTLRVKLEVKEVDILKIKKGQIVEITGDAFSEKTLNGTVKSIGSVALKDQGLNNNDEAFIEVLVEVKNTDNMLKPGLSVNAKIITDSRRDAVTVQFDTIQEDKDENKWVFVVQDDIAKQVDVEVGINSELDLEVISGLKGDETLVQDPPSRLKDGMRVIIQGAETK